MIYPEICALITMMAPNLAMFRRLQIACHAFKLSSAQQFLVRCRERELVIRKESFSTKYLYMLSRKDGLCVHEVPHSAFVNLYWIEYYINGVSIGKSVCDVEGMYHPA